MQYYEVFVAEVRYQKHGPLTYAADKKLEPGQIVSVPYGRKEVVGFIAKQVDKPAFTTKLIISDSPYALPLSSRRLHAWMRDFYPYGAGPVTSLFLPSDALKSESKKTAAKTLQHTEASATLPTLTPQQSAALHTILSSTQKAFLLHGETGSGKTRIYLELAKQAIQDGQSVLVLTPEISLTPQLVEVFEQNFGNQIVALHSNITKANRRKRWQYILSTTEPTVVIGTRSALFAPLKNIGLIIVDEMHEPAYKQDSSPRYYALRAAAAAARLHEARIVYGSATPSITDYYLAVQKKTPLLRLTESAKASAPVKKTIVDLRDPSELSRHRSLSNSLIAALEQRLLRHEQSLLFLNRRGTARQILCQDCGWQALCPRCDLPLTFHADAHHLRCHTCGSIQPPPFSCPECSGSDISYRSLGTKALTDTLQGLFPEARIARFDTDNTAADSLERNFAALQSGAIDIVVGTQMLGKGLDLPHLSLVGIVNADTSLSMPDFSSAERNYQLLHQAIGRVGRGHIDGEVIVQSFRPEDPLLMAAVQQDWNQLYTREITERKNFQFPPFAFLLKLVASRSTADAAETYLHKLYRAVADMKLPVRIEDPTPCFYERSHGKYNWQLVIKAKNRSLLTAIMKDLPSGDYSVDIDPLNLL